MLKFKLIFLASLLLASCNKENKNIFTELNNSESVSQTTGVSDYESQWFQYPDSTCRKLLDLCVVK